MATYSTVLKDEQALEYIEKTLGETIDNLIVFPKFLMLETINVCNARCIMCGIPFDKKKKAVMTDELFNKIIGELGQYSNHIKKVMMYLDGEPLLDTKIASRIKKVKQAGIRIVNMASNASLLDQKMAAEIIKAGLDQIYITLDSLNKDVFETIRKGLKFDTIYKNIHGFIKLRDRINPHLVIRVQMILLELNWEEEDAFIKHWQPYLKPNDQVVVQKAHNWGSTIKTLNFGDEEIINNVPCVSLWGSFCIHVDGTVGLCCMDTQNSMSLGNLSNQTIAQIWRGEFLKKIREIHSKGRRAEFPLCNGCTTWRDSKHAREEIIGTN